MQRRLLQPQSLAQHKYLFNQTARFQEGLFKDQANSSASFFHSSMLPPEQLIFSAEYVSQHNESYSRVYIQDHVSTFEESLQRPHTTVMHLQGENFLGGELARVDMPEHFRINFSNSDTNHSAYVWAGSSAGGHPSRFFSTTTASWAHTHEAQPTHGEVQQTRISDKISSFEDTLRMYPSRLSVPSFASDIRREQLVRPVELHLASTPYYVQANQATTVSCGEGGMYTTAVHARPAQAETIGASAGVVADEGRWVGGAYDGVDLDPFGPVVCC